MICRPVFCLVVAEHEVERALLDGRHDEQGVEGVDEEEEQDGEDDEGEFEHEGSLLDRVIFLS